MHIALVDVPADPVRVGMVPGVADALVPGLEVLAGPVGADPRDHGALVDVGAAVVLAGALRTQRLVLLAAGLRALLAGHAPSELQT